MFFRISQNIHLFSGYCIYKLHRLKHPYKHDRYYQAYSGHQRKYLCSPRALSMVACITLHRAVLKHNLQSRPLCGPVGLPHVD